jgi:diguanylate cyclase (GGDEF)-like protein/PAS domain S-box-containing protein
MTTTQSMRWEEERFQYPIVWRLRNRWSSNRPVTACRVWQKVLTMQDGSGPTALIQAGGKGAAHYQEKGIPHQGNGLMKQDTIIPGWNLFPDQRLAEKGEPATESGKLLVVDDDRLSRELMRRRLEPQGYTVSTAASGAHALEWIRSNSVDLVLMDIEMPGMTGLEAVKVLRQTYSPLRLPVIMVTGNTRSSDMVAALNLGANDYVTKPVDFPVCLARVRTQLSLKRAEEALRNSEERYALAANGANDGLWDWDLQGNEIYFSSRWKSMLGCEEKDIKNHPNDWFQRVHPDDIEGLRSEIAAHIDGITAHYETEYRMLHRDGNYCWMLGRGLAVRDATGKAYRMAGSQTDITRGKMDDALTGLPNRILFMDRLGRMLERCKRAKDLILAVLYLDLDGFKRINDSFGHEAGDQLLVALANRLESGLRSADTVARLGKNHTVARVGGDEFTILLDDIKNPENASRVVERIQEFLARPFIVGTQEVFLNASIGVALGSSSSQSPEDLLRDAGTAMYRARMTGKAGYEFFDPKMRASALIRLQIESELRRAIEREEFENHYQVIVSLQTKQIHGFEALVRWQHPSRGLLPPAEFLNVAEETGLIIPIEYSVLRSACRRMRYWQVRFPSVPNLTVTVNLCSKHFQQPSLLQHCKQILQETGLPPGSLKLELTESAVMADPEAARNMMLQLKSMGIRLALDDFGTGYSSLSHLHRFPLDTLKVDKSFVNRIGMDEESLEIARTIVSLARNLGLNVIAEGVETATQLSAVRHLGCEHAQGYYFSRPVDAKRAADLIAAKPEW